MSKSKLTIGELIDMSERDRLADVPLHLSRCPFCGGEAVLCKEPALTLDDYHYVKCSDCAAHTAAYFGAHATIDCVNAWNRRFKND